MESFTKNARKSARDIAYYRQRFKNRVHSKLVSFLTACAQEDKITQKDIADRLDKDPGLISRWLREPSNLTLDTISDLLLAVDADADPPEMIRFRNRPPANYTHPLIVRLTGKPSAPRGSFQEVHDTAAKPQLVLIDPDQQAKSWKFNKAA